MASPNDAMDCVLGSDLAIEKIHNTGDEIDRRMVIDSERAWETKKRETSEPNVKVMPVIKGCLLFDSLLATYVMRRCRCPAQTVKWHLLVWPALTYP